jgi:hypothetical protein
MHRLLLDTLAKADISNYTDTGSSRTPSHNTHVVHAVLGEMLQQQSQPVSPRSRSRTTQSHTGEEEGPEVGAPSNLTRMMPAGFDTSPLLELFSGRAQLDTSDAGREKQWRHHQLRLVAKLQLQL